MPLFGTIAESWFKDIECRSMDTLETQTNTNDAGGTSIFIPSITERKLAEALEDMPCDVGFSDNPVLATDFGKFSYIHKVHDGRDVYYFANSSDETIKTDILLRGRLELQSWNPHDGVVSPIEEIEMQERDGEWYTKCPLSLESVSSVFWLTK